MKISAIIQARMSSERLPGKVLKKIGKYSMFEIMIRRLKKAKMIDKIIVATTYCREDNKIVDFCKKKKIFCFRGSNWDSLKRYYDAAKKYKLKKIVRLTADCPLIDYKIIDNMITKFNSENIDYLSNTCPYPSTFPDGSDCEIFNFKTLKISHKKAYLPSDREHVTFFMWNKKKRFKSKRFDRKKSLWNYRYTVDYKDDLKLIRSIYDKHKERIFDLSTEEIVKFIDKNKSLIEYQKKLYRDIGWQRSFKKDKVFKKNGRYK